MSSKEITSNAAQDTPLKPESGSTRRMPPKKQPEKMQQEKKSRLSEALRANLRRRKEQARARKD